MRSDIAKVITERERRGGYGRLRKKGYKKRLQRDGLDVVKRESIKELKGDTKNFTDVIGPLYGFLRKNCGRPWDKVFSEVSQVLPAKGGVSLSHARDHLFDMVELKTQKIDGVICDTKGDPLGSHWRHGQFYVDSYGILRVMKQERSWFKYQASKKPVFAKNDEGEWLIEYEGIWYACVIEKLKPTEFGYDWYGRGTPRATDWEPAYDVLLKRSLRVPSWRHGFYGESDLYCAAKRQMNSRDIRKYKLRQKAA